MVRLRTRCANAHKYTGFGEPYCGMKDHCCDSCIDKYLAAQTEYLMHNKQGDDPMLVQLIAGKMADTLRKRLTDG